jgi:hypothetical protein
MTDMRDAHYTTETIDRGITGTYTGKRYGGMSDDVVYADLSVAYRFDGFVIVVNGIPAKWDRQTGTEYITGRVGRDVYEYVARIARALLRQQTAARTASEAATHAPEERAREIAAMIVRSTPKIISIHPELAA